MPYTNANSIQAVYNKDATAMLKGTAVCPGTGLTTRAVNIVHPVAEDDWFFGVIQDSDIEANTLGNAYQIPFSNVQVRLASAVVKGDLLNVANALGEFQTAKVGAKNVAFVALSAGAAGTDTTWACPIGTRPL